MCGASRLGTASYPAETPPPHGQAKGGCPIHRSFTAMSGTFDPEEANRSHPAPHTQTAH